VVGISPRQAEDVGEESLCEAVPTDHLFREADSIGGQADSTRGLLYQSFRVEASDHFRDGGAGDLKALSNPGLNHIQGVLLQFKDALAVLFEGGVVLAGTGHGSSLPTGLRVRQDWP
jgi:hypothetical protein